MTPELNERKKLAERGLISLVAKKSKSSTKFLSYQTLGIPTLMKEQDDLLDILNSSDTDGSNQNN